MESNQQPNIFQSMFSLINRDSMTQQPPSLDLPNPFEFSRVQTQSYQLPQISYKDLEQIVQKKTNTNCPHKNRQHYAKNMCSNCYHKQGKKKLAWQCQHKDRLHYAKGRCQFCYLKEYHKAKQRKLRRMYYNKGIY